MIPVTYTLTPQIQDDLFAIDKLYRSIMLTPLPIFVEQQLRWKAMNEQIHGSLGLAGFAVNASSVSRLLLHPHKHPTPLEAQILAYKHALEVIRSDWTASTRELRLAHIGAIGIITAPALARKIMHALHTEEAELNKLLTYIGSQKDHPVILSGVVYGLLMQSQIGILTHGLVPRIIARLLIVKYGYDCRSMVAFEPAWCAHATSHHKAIQSITTNENLTAWIEHLVTSTRNQYETVYTHMQSSYALGTGTIRQFAWRLNNREEKILEYLENPSAKITNKTAQTLFRVSAVTASRDLARLGALGLILSHGKGRSVYYTKA